LDIPFILIFLSPRDWTPSLSESRYSNCEQSQPCPQRLCLRSGAVSKPRPVPETKTWNEDINFGLHVNAPLRKHFVGGSYFLRVESTLSLAPSFISIVFKSLISFVIFINSSLVCRIFISSFSAVLSK